MTSRINKDDFVAMSPLERIRAIDEAYGPRALQLASMQKTSCMIMHMIHRIKGRTLILFVDTQYHFQETLDLRDEYINKYGLDIVTVTPELTPEQQDRHYGRELYKFVDGQPICCEERKEKPFLKVARAEGTQATIAGLLRDEGGSRKTIGPIGHDPRVDAVTFHPLFDLTHEQVDEYIKEHDLPVHALYAENYLSIGCATCTTPVRPGEDRRAGRWRHLRDEDGQKPEYCNINFSDLGGGI